MTPKAFFDLAQSLGPNVVVRTILDSTQFQISGKAFATLGWPEEGWAVVKIDPTSLRWALSLSDGLSLETGRRRAGIVLARLAATDDGVAAGLLMAAWRYANRSSGRRDRHVQATGERVRTAA